MLHQPVLEASLRRLALAQHGELHLGGGAIGGVEMVRLRGVRRPERDRERDDVAVAADVIGVLGPARGAALVTGDAHDGGARIGGAARGGRIGGGAELDDAGGRLRRQCERRRKKGTGISRRARFMTRGLTPLPACSCGIPMILLVPARPDPPAVEVVWRQLDLDSRHPEGCGCSASASSPRCGRGPRAHCRVGP